MVDQDDIIALTRHVRSFSDVLNLLRDTFGYDNGSSNSDEIQAQAHQRLGGVLSILKGVLEKYPDINSNEILTAAGIVIKKVKEHVYSSAGEPFGFLEATDQLALAFSSSVSDYLMGDQDVAHNLGTSQNDSPSLENLKNNETGYEYEDEKRDFLEDSREFLDSYESERAESEESLDRLAYDTQASTDAVEEADNIQDSSLTRKDDLDKALLSFQGSVDITLQRTKVWSKYAKEIINYMERRAHIESDYCKQLSKLAQTTKPGITEESFLPFQSTFATSLEDDLNYAANCQKKLQHELRERIVKTLAGQRNEHDRIRSKLKERWTKVCKKLNDSVINLKKAKSLYIQKQQELEKFVDKQDSKDDLSSSSSVVPSFSIGKKKKEEDIAKRAEEAEEYYKKCVDDANSRQRDVEKTRENVLFELRELVYQCDMTMQEITCHFFQLMKSLSAPLRIQYQTLAEDSKQYVVGNQFAEFIKLQQATSKSATPKRFAFELYVADDKSDSHKGYIGPADMSQDDQRESPTSERRRISTISAGSDSSLNRPLSPATGRRNQKSWGPLHRHSNSDDTGSISSRSLPGSPSGSPRQSRKKKHQRHSIAQNDLESREMFKKETPGPFSNLKLSRPALTHKFKKLRSSSKCKKCDSYVYFNGAECEHCGLTCHKKCLETLAIKCGRSRLPRKMTTFGVDFHKHLDATHRDDIPLIMEKCIAEIDERCLQIRGLYRLSGVKTKVEVLSQQFESAGDMVDLSNCNPNLITSVLKLYLRELPEPLMTFDLYPTFIQIAKDSSGLTFCKKDEDDEDQIDEENDSRCEECLRKLHSCIIKLPHANYYTVVRLFKHLRRVANNEIFNQMSVSNLAIIFGPTLLRPKGSPSSLSALMDMTHQARVVELLILNAQILDDDYTTSKRNAEQVDNSNSRNSKTEPEATDREASGDDQTEKGLLSQQDMNDQGELSLSDEIQMNLPDIFKRNDSDSRDLSSSLGSLDGIPGSQSPDIDDELKDLIEPLFIGTQKSPQLTRPTSLSVAKQPARPSSPLTVLSAGTDSNLSFSSLSPLPLPDSSHVTDDLRQSKNNGSKSQPSSDSENESNTQISPKSPSPAKMLLEGLRLEPIVLREEADDSNSSESAEEYMEVVVPSPRPRRRKEATHEDRSKEDAPKAKVSSDIVDSKESDEDVDLSQLNYGSSAELEEASPLSADPAPIRPDSLSPVPSSDAISSSVCGLTGDQSGEKPALRVNSNHSSMPESSPKSKAPKVMPKPTSPKSASPPESCCNKSSDDISESNSSVAGEPKRLEGIGDVGNASKSPSTTATSAPRDSASARGNQDNPETSIDDISCNTRNLRDLFGAVLDEKGADEVTKSEVKPSPLKDKFPSRQSSFEIDARERSGSFEFGRRGSSTAKLVEKFSRESEMKSENNNRVEGSPLISAKRVSVRKMLKQFESGDEMDGDESDSSKRQTSLSNQGDISTYRETAMSKQTAPQLSKERRPVTYSNEKLDERIRNTVDHKNKREPKFV